MDVLKSIAYPDELMAIVKFKLGGCNTVQPKHDLVSLIKVLFFMDYLLEVLTLHENILNVLLYMLTCMKWLHVY